ncbi:Mn(2+) transporter ATX2 [Rhodotorula paludigena]|uniref:Mn(2+) transporter ATX2 n=1 Tax=Rhodotorula paludigena TaxID=86838 RepID=UPI00317E692C
MAFARLVVLASAMLVATLLAGFAPLYVRLSPYKVRVTETISVGILVGAALSIIVPEGVAAVFENTVPDDDGDGHGHEANAGWIGAALLAGFVLMYLIDALHGHDEYPDPRGHSHSHSHGHHHHHHRPQPAFRQPSHLAEIEPLSNGAGRDSSEYTGRAGDDQTLRWQEDGGASAASRSPYRSGASTPADDPHLITADVSSVSTVIGLLTHSLADGISLGASSLPLTSAAVHSTRALVRRAATAAAAGVEHDHEGASHGGSLQLIIFLAIMLHKAPTAFALSSLLSSSPATSPAFTRRALLAFSLAAPLGALVTYALLSLVGAQGGDGSTTGWWTGLALVFSGGTFLFVATHAVREQEKKNERGEDEPGALSSEERLGERTRLGLILFGMVLPGLLSRLVGHGH